MTGIPSGRFSALPGLGIQTRRTGLGFRLPIVSGGFARPEQVAVGVERL